MDHPHRVPRDPNHISCEGWCIPASAPASVPRNYQSEWHTRDSDAQEHTHHQCCAELAGCPAGIGLQSYEPDDWEIVSESLDGVDMTSSSHGCRNRHDTSDLVCIFAEMVIPGRGDPIPAAAVGISTTTGVITFVGKQAELDPDLATAPRVHVGYLMPGLWDCHIHFSGVPGNINFSSIMLTNPVAAGATMARSFYDCLMSGITSVRDLSSFAIEASEAIKNGWILGPNVYGCGGAIGITGGGADGVELPLDFVRSRNATGRSNQEPGRSFFTLADGPDECRRAVREQVRRGAQCIKIIATGSVMSITDNPNLRQFSDEELRVLLEESELQGLAVAAHAHGKAGIIAAVKAGVASIEHGSYIDEEAANLMREHGTVLVATAYVGMAAMKHLDRLSPETARKMKEIVATARKGYETAIRCGVKIAIGTDNCGGDPNDPMAPGNGCYEVYLATRAGLSPLKAIEAATVNSAEVLGPRTPRKGLVKVGWDADLIAFDSNPLENMTLFTDAKNIKYVWKSGKLVKSPRRSYWPPQAPVSGSPSTLKICC